MESPLIAEQSQTVNGMLYMLVGSISMAFMNVCAKVLKLNTEVSVLQLGLFRSFVMALGCYSHAKFSGVNPTEIP